ncbi:hypothetical protein SEA_LASTHOPE_49 [Mycobacterium phage LastHope]|uniref:Uncharacterized protein n=1 Tax=Mycobacterium phage LastHope TaxID=2015886 RepID=A0A222ZRA1_9CAUD|nr:hypothetical protein I5G99_gp059 [Mycobacterium phage LastHope]ASR87217.1 hypothetical protein SEA_LASTHOPE_49 [Mycobacterium phage LastHope]
MHRQLDAAPDPLAHLVMPLASIEAPALHDEPDMERYG